METNNTTPIKVAIVGPESSGKTTLCKELSAFFKTQWVPEFARTYLETSPEYTQKDLDFFVKEQKKQEQKFSSSPLFCDTDPLSIKVWSIYKYGSFSQYIHQEIVSSNYQLHLLLEPDLDYEIDPLREDAPLKNRIELFQLFQKELEHYNFNYFVINNLGELRTKNAIAVLKKEFSL